MAYIYQSLNLGQSFIVFAVNANLQEQIITEVKWHSQTFYLDHKYHLQWEEIRLCILIY